MTLVLQTLEIKLTMVGMVTTQFTQDIPELTQLVMMEMTAFSVRQVMTPSMVEQEMTH
jgi:hypothetical protein